MKVLIVCSGNIGRINPFIADQAAALRSLNIETDFFPVTGKGFYGYLKNLPALKKKLLEGNHDLVHAHYGLSGMLAVLQRKKPVVITFHGTDVNSSKNRLISLAASKLSSYNIVVIDNFIKKLGLKRNYSVISCGVDLEVFKPIEQQEAREMLQIHPQKKIILFSSRFDNKVKNYPLARMAANHVQSEIPEAELMEMKGFDRSQVNLLMNAADLLLVTSFTESGPLVVKEAMACNLPVVSTNVGDVQKILEGTEGVYITPYDAGHIASKVSAVIKSGRRVNTRQKVVSFENKKVAQKIKHVYESVVAGKR